MRPRIALLGLFGAGALLCGLVVTPEATQAGGAKKNFSRAEALRAFSRMQGAVPRSKSEQVRLPDPSGKLISIPVIRKAPRFEPVVVSPDVQPVNTLVKVWAAPVRHDSSTGSYQETGQYVHLSKHKWQRKERFYLYFQSATPVHVGLYQDYPNNSKPTRRVLPDERFPESYKAIMAGESYRFPILLECDDNLQDELMGIVVVRAGEPTLPISNPMPADPGEGEVERGKKLMRGQNSGLDQFSKRARSTVQGRFNATFETSTQTDPGAQTTSSNPDDVAIVAFGPEHYGFIQVTLYKD